MEIDKVFLVPLVSWWFMDDLLKNQLLRGYMVFTHPIPKMQNEAIQLQGGPQTLAKSVRLSSLIVGVVVHTSK